MSDLVVNPEDLFPDDAFHFIGEPGQAGQMGAVGPKGDQGEKVTLSQI